MVMVGEPGAPSDQAVYNRSLGETRANDVILLYQSLPYEGEHSAVAIII